MQINADFSARVVLLPGQQQFVPSPLPGVSRVMLDRAGDEVARATSLVRYAAGSGYSSHRHDGGEEILVLDGVFRDEFAEYPKGTWLRNPRYSSHTPFTGETGALIYVKTGHLSANLLGDKFIAAFS
ncbi:MAG: cupin domain-containing protein [Alishewanella aestuarii]